MKVAGREMDSAEGQNTRCVSHGAVLLLGEGHESLQKVLGQIK